MRIGTESRLLYPLHGGSRRKGKSPLWNQLKKVSRCELVLARLMHSSGSDLALKTFLGCQILPRVFDFSSCVCLRNTHLLSRAAIWSRLSSPGEIPPWVQK